MINTFSEESLHISIKRFTRPMTCVMLLLLDCISTKSKMKEEIKRQSKSFFLVTVLEYLYI